MLNTKKKSSGTAALAVSPEGQQLSPLHICIGQCTARAHAADQKALPHAIPRGLISAVVPVLTSPGTRPEHVQQRCFDCDGGSFAGLQDLQVGFVSLDLPG